MRLLITGAFQWKEEDINLLRSLGWDTVYIEREDEPITFSASEVDAIVCNWFFVWHDISEFKNLKIIQLLSAGYERVPLDYIKEHNIKLFNARGVYNIPLAEGVIWGILELYKCGKVLCRNQQNKKWEKIRGLREINNKRVCIVGAGSIGLEVAKKLSVFTDDLYGVSRHPKEEKYIKETYTFESLNEQLAQSDIIVVTLPLTKETTNLFDNNRFSLMKEGAVFVNISRGGIVDEEALSQALDKNLFGAVIDVFNEEPLSQQSELWNKENLVITPHCMFNSENNKERLWELIKNNLSENIE